MQREPAAFLWDVHEAALRIKEFVSGFDFATFSTNVLVQSAVERQFEIIGEALNQLSQFAPDIVAHPRLQTDHRVPKHSDSRLRRARSSNHLESDRTTSAGAGINCPCPVRC